MKDEIIAAFDAATADERVTLFDTLSGVLADLYWTKHAPEVILTVLNGTGMEPAPMDDEDDPDLLLWLVCPHCYKVTCTDDAGIYEVDRAERNNEAYLNYAAPRYWRSPAELDTEEIGFHISQGDGDYHTIGFECMSCRKPVTLPKYTDTTWS